jgi:hypothetical protein
MPVPNFCKPDDMSTCTAGKKWKEHNRCHFAEKSTDLNRCMFYMFDEYCDCLKAQQAEFNPVEDREMIRVDWSKALEREKREMQQEGLVAEPIDVTKAQVKKICPIDFTSICDKSFCSHWNWCKEPFKNK